MIVIARTVMYLLALYHIVPRHVCRWPLSSSRILSYLVKKLPDVSLQRSSSLDFGLMLDTGCIDGLSNRNEEMKKSISQSKLIQMLRMSKRYSTTNQVEKTVIISESNDIYTNLALEDWYYSNWDPQNRNMLMLWSNNPCVVIGKFQNPWLEANVSELGYLKPEGVKLARRNSGGGTVYHDRGNLNLTFFTPREQYNRRHNLEIITKAISKEYGLQIDISKRDDLVLGNRKVSGTAAKLARTIAYHHCTLLVNSDRKTLSSSLRKPRYEIKTNATQSIPSEIANLTDIDKNITVEDLMVSIGKVYLRTPAYNKKAATKTNRKDATLMTTADNIVTKFHILRPTEEEFAGLTEIRDSLVSWEWTFGKCPKFTATAIKSYPYTSEQEEGDWNKMSISFDVENGRVCSAKAQFPSDAKQGDVHVELDDFKDRKFAEELFDEASNSVWRQLKVKNYKVIA